jgi:hypothetical protein
MVFKIEHQAFTQVTYHFLIPVQARLALTGWVLFQAPAKKKRAAW